MTEGSFRIIVPTNPATKQRARGTREGVHFTPKQTVVAESWIRLCCTEQVGAPCLEGPIALRVGLFLAAPKSMGRRDREEAESLRAPCTRKPDWDNAAKLVADALNGIAWRDDAQVADARVVKLWAPAGRGPVTVIRWWRLAPGEIAAVGWGLLDEKESQRAAALALL